MKTKLLDLHIVQEVFVNLTLNITWVYVGKLIRRDTFNVDKHAIDALFTLNKRLLKLYFISYVMCKRECYFSVLSILPLVSLFCTIFDVTKKTRSARALLERT